jgi:hypothetical protein
MAKESKLKKALEEYHGNVSFTKVSDVHVSGKDEDLFEGVVVHGNVYFCEGEQITFRYGSIGDDNRGVAFIDGNQFPPTGALPPRYKLVA